MNIKSNESEVNEFIDSCGAFELETSSSCYPYLQLSVEESKTNL